MSRIVGVKHQMGIFSYSFGVSLGLLIFSHSINLSRTLQHAYMSAVEGQSVANMSVKTLQALRSDTQFDLFWAKVISSACELNINEPSLPHKQKFPSR